MQSCLVIFSLFGLATFCAAKLSAFNQMHSGYPSVFQPQFSTEFVPSSQRAIQFFSENRRNQILEKRPQASWQLRNCYLSPMQCLLPVEQHQFNNFHKRVIF